MKVTVTEFDALIVVDVQKDFCPGGSLAVSKGDEVVPILNRYIEVFKEKKRPIFMTRDWHPKSHISFKEMGGIWPPHCVQNTEGAKFHPDLRIPEDTFVISKGTNPKKEAYSGFDGTKLSRILKERGIRRVFVGGLATDYCVKATVLDALKKGFFAFLLSDASRGVNVKPGDAEKAEMEMLSNGAVSITFSEII